MHIWSSCTDGEPVPGIPEILFEALPSIARVKMLRFSVTSSNLETMSGFTSGLCKTLQSILVSNFNRRTRLSRSVKSKNHMVEENALIT